MIKAYIKNFKQTPQGYIILFDTQYGTAVNILNCHYKIDYANLSTAIYYDTHNHYSISNLNGYCNLRSVSCYVYWPTEYGIDPVLEHQQEYQKTLTQYDYVYRNGVMM